MRKAQDDAVARTVAENEVKDLIAADPVLGEVIDGTDFGPSIVGHFKAVEFERTAKKVGDEEIRLRRLVITGPWEVDPNGHGA